jgi:thiol:disulfide interchange protein DsbA
MKTVFSRISGIALVAATLALSGCLSESSQAEAVKQQRAAAPVPAPAVAPTSRTAPAPPPQTQQNPAQRPVATFREGFEYTVLSPPIPTNVAPGQSEVTELFWYGCPHCLALEGTMNRFQQTKPANVVFQRVPATLTPRWAYHAKLFYVGKMLDPAGQKGVHGKIFNALQVQRRTINTDDAMIRFFTEQGFTEDQVKGALNSMEMRAMLARSDEVGSMSHADSVPTIIVNGKYLTSPSKVGSEEKLLQVIDYLSKLPH